MHKFHKGFTLIEMMIVVAIMAILVAIALPSYRDYILRSHRVEARNTLQEAAQKMQQNRSVTRTFNTQADGTSITNQTLVNWGLNRTPLGANPNKIRYNISFVANPTASAYTLQAVPTGAQAGDDCGTFTLNQANSKTANGQGSRADISIECWSN